MRIVFIGMSGEYSLRHLEALEEKFEIVAVICAAPRGYVGEDDSFSKRNMLYKNTKKRGIPFYFAKNISSIKIESVIRNADCDLICIASCSQLVKRNIIDIPKKGIINAHPAKLPYYKGPNPDYWIFYYQEKEGAVTIHFIDEGEDSGDIIHQELFKIPFGMTRAEYRNEILRRSPALMQQSVSEIGAGIVKRKKQKEVVSFRARNLKPEDKEIDFKSWKADRAYHFLRGTDMLNIQYEKTVWNVSIEGYIEGTDSHLNRKNIIPCESGGYFTESISVSRGWSSLFSGEIKRHRFLKDLAMELKT